MGKKTVRGHDIANRFVYSLKVGISLLLLYAERPKKSMGAVEIIFQAQQKMQECRLFFVNLIKKSNLDSVCLAYQ